MERAGLEAVAVGAVEIDDGMAEGRIALDDGFGNYFGFVRGVVEDLDFEPVAGIVELTDGIDEAIDDKLLVEDGELDGDAGELLESGEVGSWVAFFRWW